MNRQCDYCSTEEKDRSEWLTIISSVSNQVAVTEKVHSFCSWKCVVKHAFDDKGVVMEVL